MNRAGIGLAVILVAIAILAGLNIGANVPFVLIVIGLILYLLP